MEENLTVKIKDEDVPTPAYDMLYTSKIVNLRYMNFMSRYMNDRIVNGILKYEDTNDDIDILRTFFERRGWKDALIKHMEKELQNSTYEDQ